MSHPDTELHDIKPDSFIQNFSVILLLLVAFGFAIFYAAGIASRALTPDVPDPELVALSDARIQPVGQVRVGDAGGTTSAAAEGPVDGTQVYNTACVACHATGAAGAPKYGDKAAWAPRLAQGIEVLHQHSISGFKAMPAKGGFSNLSDAQVQAAVDYMVEAVK